MPFIPNSVKIGFSQTLKTFLLSLMQKVYIHFVWSTKNRYTFLSSPELRAKVWQHMRDNEKRKTFILTLLMVFLIIVIVLCL